MLNKVVIAEEADGNIQIKKEWMCVCKTMDGKCSATLMEGGPLLSGTMYFCL